MGGNTYFFTLNLNREIVWLPNNLIFNAFFVNKNGHLNNFIKVFLEKNNHAILFSYSEHVPLFLSTALFILNNRLGAFQPCQVTFGLFQLLTYRIHCRSAPFLIPFQALPILDYCLFNTLNLIMRVQHLDIKAFRIL